MHWVLYCSIKQLKHNPQLFASRFGKPTLEAISGNGPLGSYDSLAADGWQSCPRDVALLVYVSQVIDSININQYGMIAAHTYTLCGKFMPRCQRLLSAESACKW